MVAVDSVKVTQPKALIQESESPIGMKRGQLRGRSDVVATRRAAAICTQFPVHNARPEDTHTMNTLTSLPVWRRYLLAAARKTKAGSKPFLRPSQERGVRVRKTPGQRAIAPHWITSKPETTVFECARLPAPFQRAVLVASFDRGPKAHDRNAAPIQGKH